VERLIALVLILGAFVSCAPDPRGSLDPRFAQAVTALRVTSYEEDAQTHHFLRSVAWGEIPEKLVPDGEGGYTAVIPLLVQSETSDGPQPDRFWNVLVRGIRDGDTFTLAPNEALPGAYQTWHDAGRRTVWFLGKTWQFQGRY